MRWLELSPYPSRVLFAFQAGFSGQINAFSAPIEGGSLRILDDSVFQARVLPDSSAGVYERDTGVFRAPLDAGAPPVQLASGFLFDRRLTITPDGSRLLFSRADGLPAEYHLFSVPTDGSALPVQVDLPMSAQPYSIPLLRDLRRPT